MRLYELLQDRAAINMLKLLSERDLQKSYAVKLAEMQRQFPMFSVPAAAQRLIQAELVGADAVNNDAVLAITEKGKRFISVFDQLVAVANGQKMEKKTNGMRIQYELTMLERQMLHAVKKVAEGKTAVSIHAIARNLYPTEPGKNVGILRQQSKQLAELGLLHSRQIGKNVLVQITTQGKQILQE